MKANENIINDVYVCVRDSVTAGVVDHIGDRGMYRVWSIVKNRVWYNVDQIAADDIRFSVLNKLESQYEPNE